MWKRLKKKLYVIWSYCMNFMNRFWITITYWTFEVPKPSVIIHITNLLYFETKLPPIFFYPHFKGADLYSLSSQPLPPLLHPPFLPSHGSRSMYLSHLHPVPTKTALSSYHYHHWCFHLQIFILLGLDELGHPTFSWCNNLLLRVLPPHDVLNLHNFHIAHHHSSIPSHYLEHPTHHLKEWRWSTSCRKKESCCFNVTLFNTFLEVWATKSISLYQ